MKNKNIFKNPPLLVLLYVVYILVSAIMRTFLLFPVGIFSAAYVFAPYPGTPDVKYAEIPFEITYEISEKQESCTDAVICEYEGWTVINDVNKESVWSEHLKSGNIGVVIAEQGDVLLCTEYGKAENYIAKRSDAKFEIKLFTYDKINGIRNNISQEEAYDLFGVKNIKCLPIDTIEINYHNSFLDMLSTKID